MEKRKHEGNDDRDSKQAKQLHSQQGEQSDVSSSNGMFGQDAQMGTGRDPQAGGSIAGGTGSSQMATIIRNPRINHYNITLKKRFQIYTAGIQFKYIGIPGAPFQDPQGDTNAFMVTPLASINPDMFAIYGTKAEFGNLPSYSYATQARIKITPLGFRLPFATGEGASQYANSQTLVQIASGVGINKQVNMVEGAIMVDETDLTNPTAVSDSLFNCWNTLYGQDGSIGACVGFPRNWNRYTTVYVPNGAVGPAGFSDGMMLNKMIDVQNINDCKGMPVINYVHDFKCGLLKFSPAECARYYLRPSNPNYYIPNGNYDSLYHAVSNLNTPDFPNTPQDILYQSNSLRNVRDNIAQWVDPELQIEKCAWISTNLSKANQPDATPLLHFGVFPVQSNAPFAPAPSFSNVAAQWEVETELDIVSTMDFTSCIEMFPVIQAWDPYISTGTPHDTNILNYYCSGRLLNGASPYTGLFQAAITRTAAQRTDDVKPANDLLKKKPIKVLFK